MKFLFVTIFTLIVLVSFKLYYPQNVYAEGEFETDYQVQYTILESGKTQVSEDIILKNKTANYYADKFELKIGSTKVSEVRASDRVGPMQADVKFENNITTITVKFNERVIGLDKTLPWKLAYSSQELATKSGQIWEVSIPRLAKNSDIGKYEASVATPVTFGPNAFAYPTPLETLRQGRNQVYSFNKEQLTTSGISMSFGEKQVFEYTLNYYLYNKNVTAQIQEITLPPDNNYQKVVLSSIEPPPVDVILDSDSNYVAKYRLGPKSGLNIAVKGYVEVFSKPSRNIDNNLSAQERKKYTSPQKYWEIDSPEIRDKASDLKSPQEIYDFVSNYLTYSEQKLNQKNIERLGALAAYTNPREAVCMEFTDLFIALARAKGIPAREVVGYAYTQNSRLRPLSFETQGDLLHAWPEYWDDKLGWVQIDPTWASTSGGLDYFNKLDFNHITLIQRGTSSTAPLPAGSYKKEEDQGKKYVYVSFATSLPIVTATPQIEIDAPQKIISGVPTNIKASIRNIGSSAIVPTNLLLETTTLKITSENPKKVEVMPPFSKREIEFKVQSSGYLAKKDETLVLTFGEVQASKNVSIIPFYYLAISPSFMATISLSALIIIFGLLLYNKLHKKKIKLPHHLQ
ncbi:hypothetical protein HY382_01895 [Candidatus Curtissbacteria bacterium]|nr:hypothetical protein [Candidatus Curtissbacteria bacterium]